jgi:tryptophan synthase alpha subunit
VILVTVQGFSDPSVDGKTIRLTPSNAAGTPMSSPANLGQTVARWRYRSGATNGVPARILPADCR